MYRCEACGSSDGFVLDFREVIYGRVVAHWDDASDGWECDWDTRKDDDGDVSYGDVGEVECTRCGSHRVDEHDPDDEEPRVVPRIADEPGRPATGGDVV